MTDDILVNELSKTYQVPEREGGFGAAVRSFFHRRYRDVHAVQEVSFRIQSGEIVGFLGPNGAGKTTTLKMLSGLLHPTGGKARVLGFTPWERKRDFLQSITLVMGQRNRLSWDIPAADSFLLNQAIYRLPDDEYKRTLNELDELLELAPIMRKPVRNLSLGERMKCELAAGLLHRPQVLFLDEPTIGLDITAQARIRSFPAGVQPPHRGHHPAHQPLHGRCDRPVRADHHHPPRAAQVRWRDQRSVAPHRPVQADLRDAERWSRLRSEPLWHPHPANENGDCQADDPGASRRGGRRSRRACWPTCPCRT